MNKIISSLVLLSLPNFVLAQEPTPEPKKEITGEQLKQLGRFMLRGPIKKAEVTSARVTMANLAIAIDAFYEEYQALPLGSKATVDTTVTTVGKKGSPFMASLLGLKSAQDENPKRMAFFESKMAKKKKDGLARFENGADLYDPWGKPYQVHLNYDYDNQLRSPIGNEIIFERRALIWSTGPDGKSGTPETDKDNVYSWK